MQSINLSDLKTALIRLSILCAIVLLCVGARAESGGGAGAGDAGEASSESGAAANGAAAENAESGTSPGAEAKAGGDKADRSDFADDRAGRSVRFP